MGVLSEFEINGGYLKERSDMPQVRKQGDKLFSSFVMEIGVKK